MAGFLPAAAPIVNGLRDRPTLSTSRAVTGGKIVIAGAGSIGCFVGGLLAAAGRDVVLLARFRIEEELAAHGLHLTSLEGWSLRPAPQVTTDPADALTAADLVLVTVKSGATAEMGRLIADHAPTTSPIISLQNGVNNAALLRSILPGRTILAGMVSFNVLHRGSGRFHRGTSGPVIIEAGVPDALASLNVPYLHVEAAQDISAVQWGKLLLNLNNALNALSGLPLREQLLDPRWRRLLAASQQELLDLLDAARIQPWSMGPLPARWLPRLLRLPTPLFRIAARSAVTIDPHARSSMWEDLERRRPTEVGELQGAVIELATRLGRPAPVAERIVQAIRLAEDARRGSPQLDPAALSR